MTFEEFVVQVGVAYQDLGGDFEEVDGEELEGKYFFAIPPKEASYSLFCFYHPEVRRKNVTEGKAGLRYTHHGIKVGKARAEAMVLKMKNAMCRDRREQAGNEAAE